MATSSKRENQKPNLEIFLSGIDKLFIMKNLKFVGGVLLIGILLIPSLVLGQITRTVTGKAPIDIQTPHHFAKDKKIHQSAVYNAPTNCVITDYQLTVHSTNGPGAKSVDFVQGGSSYVSQQEISDAFSSAINLAVSLNIKGQDLADLKANLVQKQSQYNSIQNKIGASHTTIEHKAHVSGQGIFRGARAWYKASVNVELFCCDQMCSKDELDDYLAQFVQDYANSLGNNGGSTIVNAQNASTLRIVEYGYQKGVASPKGTPYTFTINKAPELEPTYGKEDKARFEYYLEFGDGQYTRIKDENQPIEHVYTKAGIREPLMRVTGIYDDGDDPDARIDNSSPLNVDITVAPQPTRTENIIENGSIEMEIHRTVNGIRPEEENIIILKYRNMQATPQSGKLLLFYNEKGRGETNRDYIQQFDLMGVPRIYSQAKDFVYEKYRVNGETQNLSEEKLNTFFPNNNQAKEMVAEARERFKNYLLFNFDRLDPFRQSHIFISLKTDEKIGNINGKEVFIDAVFAPNVGIPETTRLELEVNMARDPNSIAVSETQESFRGAEDKKLEYIVRYQNEADAPAKHVFVDIEVPEGLEVDKVKHLKNSFGVKRCTDKKDVPCYDIDISEKDTIKFSFMRVSLPGLNDPEVKKYKETVGWFKYEITYKEKLKKQPISIRAHITFKDEVKTQSVVTTNPTTTRFKPGLSIGPKFGIDYNATDGQPSYFIGAVASPYKSERFYYQPEIMLRYSQFECDYDREYLDRDRCRLINEAGNFEIEGPYEVGDTVQLRDSIAFNNSEWKVESNSFIVDIVPLQIRKDIGKFLSLGAGADIGIVFQKNKIFRDTSTTTVRYRSIDGVWTFDDIFETYSNEFSDENDIYIDGSLFFDITVGSVKAGPALSIRYLREFLPLSPKNIEAINSSRLSNKNRLQASLLWKF